MHKAMTLMNLQLSNAISDVAGVTGQKIVRAIVAGERDPQVLAAYRDCRIKATEEEIAASLLGAPRRFVWTPVQNPGSWSSPVGMWAGCI